MDDCSLPQLEERICDLENHLVPSDGDNSKIMKCCIDVHDTLQTFASKRERFNQTFKRAEDISMYVSPGFMDTISMDNVCEKEVVLAAEQDLRAMSEQFEEIEKLSKALDSTHINEVSKHRAKLEKLQVIQQQQMVDASKVSDDLHDLLSAYNDLVTYLSETFVKWDHTISQLEERKTNDES